MDIVAVPAAAREPKEVRPRQCGRCRQLFEGDPTLHPSALPEWWVCPPCRTTLFGQETRTNATATARP